jgi:hypothetical protein
MGLFRKNPTQRDTEMDYMKGGGKNFNSCSNFPSGDLHWRKEDSQNEREGGVGGGEVYVTHSNRELH